MHHTDNREVKEFMVTYILVHGGNMSVRTWNRLTTGEPVATPDGTMGGRIWDPVIPALTRHGHRVIAPTLLDEHTHDLSEHIRQTGSLVPDGCDRDIILAGHSYGGMIITGLAARIPGRIRGLVYIDAALPGPGQSLFDIIASAGRDPLSFAGLEADPPYVEKLQFDPALIRPLRKTYILCTASEFLPVTLAARAQIAQAGLGWTYHELPTSHVPMAGMPGEVSRLLLDAAGPDYGSDPQ
jgi:pimeloyl-ACP methyl ester carboxylesterase